MRSVKVIIAAAALAATLTACGKDSDGDGDDKKNDGTGTGGDGAIPSDFENKAGSKAEFSSKLTSVKTEVVDSAATGLGLKGGSTLKALVLKGLLDETTDDTTDDTADDTADDSDDTADTDDDSDDDSDDGIGSLFSLPDFDVFSQDLAAGADCGAMFQQLEKGFEGFSGQIQTFDTQVKQFGDDFGASGLEQLYTVEDKKAEDGGKYAFHYVMTKKEQSGDENPGLAFLPDLEIAGGASDDEIAMLLRTKMEFAPPTGEGGEAGDTNFKLDMAYELYANVPEKVLSIGFDADINVTQGGKENAVSTAGKSTIKGGELPSMVVEMTFDGTNPDDGKALKGDLSYGVEKTSADALKVYWKGNFQDTSVNETVTVTRTGTTCKVDKVGA
jgi:hypothetical protein